LKAPEFPWEKKEELIGSLSSSPLIHDGLVYYMTSKGCLLVYDLNAGTEVYRQMIDFGAESLNNGHRPYGCGVMSSLTFADGRIYIFGNNGTCVIVQPGKTYKKIASNTMLKKFVYDWKERPEGWVSNPFFEGKRMYYRAQKHMYCIGGAP
ncbi:MAG: hypothetical protein HRU15_16015, partial [Planctomycetes bacterium]|nr:hypothetical protein [Planctomycetota bacterium]